MSETPGFPTQTVFGFRLRLALVLALGVGFAVWLWSRPAIPQDLHYHAFADQRPLLGIPHCLNVISNVPFLIVGGIGLGFTLSARGREVFRHPSERQAYAVFALGVALTAFGSAYYHLDPNNERLLWDRLPMSVAFMALFAAVVGERVSPVAGAWLLWPLVGLGLASVLYWHHGEQMGAGDLRPYYLVQFYPMIALPLLLLLFPSRHSGTAALFIALAFYVVAKLVEIYDVELYHSLGEVSGHTLKHLLAAGGAYAVVRMIRHRTPLRDGMATSG